MNQLNFLMNFQKSIFSLFISLLICGSLMAQKFSPALKGFSHKKISYLTLDNGKEVKGTIKDLDWKKGLIEEVKLKDMDDKKVKIKPEEINFMYLPPSNLAKLGSTFDFLENADMWQSADLDKDILGKGYVYMEKSEVRIKKKTRTLMMQLINPSFSNKIKVYDDPFAKETMGAGIGGVTLVGGDEKSYYIKKAGDKVAYRLHKKNYDEEFKMIFKNCKEVMKKYGSNPKWTDFEAAVYEYTQGCK